MITPLSVSVPWKDHWAIKISRWQAQLRLQPSEAKHRPPARSRNDKAAKRQQQLQTAHISTNSPGIITHKPPKQSAKDSSRPNIDLLANGYTHGGRYYLKGFPR
ncbi:hypothetical protein BsWGS_07316 [Bradybaena similaris]